MRGERFDAAQHRRVQRAHAHGRLQARDQAARPASEASSGSAIGTAASSIAVHAGDGRHDRAAGGRDLQAEHARGGFAWRRPGSAMTTAAGLTATKAVGASAHFVSTMGKAPAGLSASMSSVAGFSATTIIGPCSDMDTRNATVTGVQTLTGAVNTASTTAEITRRPPRRLARKAPTISGLTPRRRSSLDRHGAVDGVPGQALAGQLVRQGGQRRVRLPAARASRVELAGREAIAADGGDAGEAPVTINERPSAAKRQG